MVYLRRMGKWKLSDITTIFCSFFFSSIRRNGRNDEKIHGIGSAGGGVCVWVWNRDGETNLQEKRITVFS